MMVLGKLYIHLLKNETGPLFYTVYKNKLRIDQIIKCKRGHKKYNKKEYFLGPVFLQKKGKLFTEYYKRELLSREILLKVLPKNYMMKRYLTKKEIKMIESEL